jgi:hypothetical protein
MAMRGEGGGAAGSIRLSDEGIPSGADDAFVMMDLSAHFNNDSISHRGNLTDGSFNVWGNTFPAEELPPSGATVVVGGVPFSFPPKEDGAMNTVVCDGQLLDTRPGLYDWFYFLGASERRTEDWVYLHYAGGAVDPEWLRISDFWPPGPPRFGEIEAFRCRVMHYPHHVQANLQPVIWRQRVPVTRRQPLERIRLPVNVAIHLFAVTLARPRVP